MLGKKAQDITWSTIGKWVLILMAIIVIVLIIYIFRDKMLEMIRKLGDLLAFGG